MTARHTAPDDTLHFHAGQASSRRDAGEAPPAPAAPRRRITIVTSATAWGGAERQATALARTLAARAHDVTLLEVGGRWLDHPEVHAAREGCRTLRVVHLPGPRLRGLSVPAALRALRPHAGDVCVVSKPSFGERARGVDAAARLLFRRYVRWEHHPAPPHEPRPRLSVSGGVPHLGLWWHRQRLELLLHTRAAHRVITVSEVVRDHLAAIPGFDAARTVRVHCGIDTAAFTASAERRARARLAFGLADHDIVLGAVGRVAENKRYDVALRTFRELVERRPDLPLRFLLGGVGPDLAALRELAETLGVGARVVFAGRVPHAADALCAIDVFLMPSRVEGLGIALLEAMACGCACVAMNSGGPAEILREPALGWLVPADDEGAFTAAAADAVAEVAGEPVPAERRRGRIARAHVERHFTAARQLELLADAVERS